MNQNLQMLALADAHEARVETIEEMNRLPTAVQDAADDLHAFFLAIYNDAKNKVCGVVAGLEKLSAALRQNGERGATFVNLRTKYYKWQAAGRDRRALVNRVKALVAPLED